MLKKLSFFAAFLFCFYFVHAQSPKRPKIVIGIILDQMRWDFLYRYTNRYKPDGFNKLTREGFSCENTFIPYTPTYTAAGHACVYTGSVPAINGIISNEWYNRELGRSWYCVQDTAAISIGSTSTAGKMSPRNMNTTTITDELRLATNFKSKCIGISIKDRGAILPAGHTANAAYWFDDATGGIISSNFYMNELPLWVKNFNSKQLPLQYMKKNWNTLYPIDTYTQSTPDNEPWEASLAGEDNTFPHITDTLSKPYTAFKQTPFCNTYCFDMARAALEGENMGMGKETDFLAVSFSACDYMGHTFGPNSVEAEDLYLRMDIDMATFLNYLDKRYGKGNYLIFLTADHGVAHVPGFAKEHKIPAGTLNDETLRTEINAKAKEKFGVANAIQTLVNYQLYINYKGLEEANVSYSEFKKWAIQMLMTNPAILYAVDLQQLPGTTVAEPIKQRLTNGYNQRLSGDIQFVFKPEWFDGGEKGTTHGMWNPYDSHIPLVWYGWNIKPGKTNREVYMTDIAPTLAALLHIQMPNGCVGKPVEEITR